MSLESGALLNNRYRIIEVLGQGGMAAVYKAIDENLGVEVAVKENLFTTEEYARQFRLEATILASMRQPNLPRVSDHFVIEPQGQYLVMDFIEGEDLRQRLDRLGPLPEQEVIIIGVAICDAIAYMHSRQPKILHRDIKPGNVRITPSGHIYLVDFGLAKVVEGREATHTGARAMTPGYSPPEQYGTARTDGRSDIYSLGATLYCALTDTLPEDGLERAMNHIELTPILRRNPKVSENVTQIIEKCLSVRPEDRYQTAEDLRYALMEARSISRRKLPLELVLQPPPITLHDHLPEAKNGFAREELQETGSKATDDIQKSTRPLEGEEKEIEILPPRAHRQKRSPAWLLLAILPVLILGGLITYTLRPESAKQAIGYIFPGFNPTHTPTLTIPTDTLALVLPINTSTSTLPLKPSSTATLTPLPTFTLPPSLTPTITLTPLPTPLGGSAQIAFASTRSGEVEIWLMNDNGTGLEQLTNIAEGACQPKWSPDGMQIVFISPCERNLVSYPGASLFIINADGTGLTPLPSVPGGDYDPSWSPDGNQIAFTSLRKSGVPGIYVMVRRNNDAVRSLVEDETRAIMQPAWSPNGAEIAYVNSDNRIWVMDVNGGNRRGLTVGGGDYRLNDPSWSPDGSVVIYTRSVLSDTTGSTVLMAVPYTPTGAQPVEVSNSDLVTDVSYSRDGYWLLFTSWFSGNHDITIMRPNGVDRHAILKDPAYDFDPAWRPLPSSQP
jgi:serine/threonine protein kinase/Tol biopolymer transport system component